MNKHYNQTRSFNGTSRRLVSVIRQLLLFKFKSGVQKAGQTDLFVCLTSMELGAPVVFDVGGLEIRAGFAGDDNPTSFPSVVGTDY